VKATQGSLQKIIHGQKSLENKGNNEIEMCWKGLWPWKLKTSMKTIFANKVIKFEKALKFKRPLGENPLRCTTQDKKGLVLIAFLFYLIFWFP
jgi:hypothetical protein